MNTPCGDHGYASLWVLCDYGNDTQDYKACLKVKIYCEPGTPEG